MSETDPRKSTDELKAAAEEIQEKPIEQDNTLPKLDQDPDETNKQTVFETPEGGIPPIDPHQVQSELETQVMPKLPDITAEARTDEELKKAVAEELKQRKIRGKIVRGKPPKKID